MNRTLLTVLVASFALIVVPNFYGYPPASASTNKKAVPGIREAYDPSLYQKLQTVDALVTYIDTTYSGNKNSPDFLNHIAQVISLRFYHSYSRYSSTDNWIAASAGQYVWDDLSAIVLPDDIMKHPYAACSQQSIILMECAKRFGFNYRKVGFDHHYAAEINVAGKWHYIDVNMEVITKNGSLNDLMRSGKLYKLYSDKLPAQQIPFFLGHPRLGQVNEAPAPQAALFQNITDWLSNYFICLVFLFHAMIFYYYYKQDHESKLDTFSFSK